MNKLFFTAVLLSLSSHSFSSSHTIPPSPFAEGKVIVQKSHVQNQDLVVLMDMECVEEQGLEELKRFSEFSVVDSSPKIRLERKVLKLKKKKPFTEARLEEFANASECIIGVSNDVPYRIDAFNDPRFSEQTQHPILETNRFYEKSPWLPVSQEDRAVIAVIDTGVDYTHGDLMNVMYRRNGSIVGANFVATASDYYDDHGHGTHVAGLAAAEGNNFQGGSGVCALSCSIMPIKVLSKDGSGYLSDITNGVFFAVDNGADILNMSLGRTLNFAGMAPLELEAFRYAMMKNVTVAVAAGNDGATLSMTGPQSWPAMFAELPGVVTVGSLDAATGALSTFSNRSSRYVELGAPGSTSSTNNTYVGLLSTAAGGGYVKMSGTSMATPVAAGAMGLIVSYLKRFNLKYTVWDVESFLKAATRSDAALKPHIEGGRVLNLSLLADQLQSTHENPFRLDVNDPYEKIVNDLYYVILRRNYDVGGAQFQLWLMKDRRFPLEHLILEVMKSPEFKSNFGDINDPEKVEYTLLKDHLIPDVYLTLLGRLPKETEADFWLDYLSAYRTKVRFFVRFILKSKEFQDRISGTVLADYPLMDRTSTDEQSYCNARNFTGDYSIEKQVDYAYCVALERTADASGRNFYVGLLRNGMSLETLIFELYKSPEFTEANGVSRIQDNRYVTMLYFSLLQRFPAPHEAYYWSDIAQRTSRDVVLRSIIESPEFNSILVNRSIRK